jgi:hypothetical protein
MARIRRRIQQDGFAEALAKAHNDGWVKGFELGKQEGVSETLANLPREQKQFIPQHGGFYLGRHIDTIGNTFSIYVEESPLVVPYRRENLLRQVDNRGNTEVMFAIQARLSIEGGLVGREIQDLMTRNGLTAYYIPYRPEGFLR